MFNEMLKIIYYVLLDMLNRVFYSFRHVENLESKMTTDVVLILQILCSPNVDTSCFTKIQRVVSPSPPPPPVEITHQQLQQQRTLSHEYGVSNSEKLITYVNNGLPYILNKL